MNEYGDTFYNCHPKITEVTTKPTMYFFHAIIDCPDVDASDFRSIADFLRNEMSQYTGLNLVPRIFEYTPGAGMTN